MANTLQHLHANKVSHGDVYAHNIMNDSKANILFGDFGAASDLSLLPTEQQLAMQKIEVRAFGCLMEDMLNISIENRQQGQLKQQLKSLKDQCLQAQAERRPSFRTIENCLETWLGAHNDR